MDHLKENCDKAIAYLNKVYAPENEKRLVHAEKCFNAILADQNYLDRLEDQPLDETFLYLGVIRNKFKVVMQGCLEFSFRALLSKDGYNIFHYAVLHASTDVIRLLLNKNFQVFVQNGMQSNPIIEAHRLKRLDVVDLLFDYTFFVTSSQKKELEEYFIGTSTYLEKMTMLMVVDAPKYFHTYSWYAPCLDDTLLFYGILKNNLGLIKRYCNISSLRNTLSREGRCALLYAVRFAGLEIIESLLKNDFFIFDSNEFDNPIIEAYQLKRFDVVGLLLNRPLRCSEENTKKLKEYFAKDAKYQKMLKFS